jgi:UDP-galactose transporter B1
MVPVMIGGLLLGGRRFKLREYLQVAAIVGGTAVFNLAKSKGGGKASSLMGLASLVASLMCDGVTGGAQVCAPRHRQGRTAITDAITDVCREN